MPFQPVVRDVLSSVIQNVLGRQRSGGGAFEIINDAGELAPYVTFTRSSTATRYNSAGLLETVAANGPRYDYDPTTVTRANYYRESGTWALATETNVVKQVENGVLFLSETAVTGNHEISFTSPISAGNQYTYQVKAKAGLRGGINLGNSGFTLAKFNLRTGQITYNQGSNAWFSSITSTIAPLNDGYFLCTVTVASVISQSAPQWRVGLSNVDNETVSGQPNYLGAVGHGVYLKEPQVEYGTTATDYIRTEASPVGNATLRGLLIEEQRTNLVDYSYQFDSAFWLKSGATVEANIAVAPDGTLTADKLKEDAATGSFGFYRGVGTLTGTYTQSIYVKPAGRSWVVISVLGNTASRTYFNLSNGTLGTVGTGITASIVPAGNGWYRLTATCTLSSQTAYVTLNLASGDGGISYTGDGASGVYVWGAQWEAGAFATSYIPTTTAAVTRAADVAQITALSSIGFNAAEGAFLVEGSFNQVGNASRIINLYDGTYANQIYFIRTTSSLYSLSSGSGGVQDGAAIAGTSTASLFKLAGAYKANDYAASLNGGSAGADTSVTTPVNVNQMLIGATRANAEVINGHIRRLRYYPKRLPNATLQALTA